MTPVDTLWCVVPVRGFALGKSRLAVTLAPEARATINRQLLARTLAAASVACGHAERCLVISPDPLARALATEARASVLDEPPAQAGGAGTDAALNTALAAGLQHVAREGATRALLIAADLPAISAEAIARFAAAVPPGHAGLVPDRHGAGTNALLLPVGAAAGLRFGADSRRAHHAAFAALGIPQVEWRDADLAFDLDTPEDWSYAIARGLLPDPGYGSSSAASS